MLDATDLTSKPAYVDFMEAGAGSLVVLVHSSMAGARQWSALTHDLQDRYLVRAVNLFGYGNTPAWSETKPPSLDDYAELVASAVPESARNVALIGHSFGGAVAMQAAAHQLRGQVERLVLIEPSPFYLLDIPDHREAFCEISSSGGIHLPLHCEQISRGGSRTVHRLLVRCWHLDCQLSRQAGRVHSVDWLAAG